ncbi:MAG: dicarboxylate/amino acid:cation symporter [Melioribacteraceae bacterium]|nr:dicarboxylate/amino acid:cation symporter [Melioribacteraceae bacterium]
MKKLQLHWQILIALFAAILFGIFLTDYVHLISWMGVLFLRALKMIVIPLIFTSIVTGVSSIGSADNLGRLGAKTFGYYLFTTTIAIITGLLFVNIIQPGVGAEIGNSEMVEGLSTANTSFGDTLINIIPTNIFEVLSTGKILPIIFFSILLGYFITKVDDKPKLLLTNFFDAAFETIMKMTMFIIKFTPFGILGLVAKVVAEQAHDNSALMAMGGHLGMYLVTVILALGVHFGITLPLILKFVGKVNPIEHLKAMRTPLLTAFSTSSSSATLPLTLEAVEHKSGVSNKITSFVLPLGATVNMDGTALYESVVVLFIAQAYGIELGIYQQIIVIITAVLASIGAAGIPMAGLVMITVILTAVGLPLEGIGAIIAVDRIVDMVRTATNVWSDSCGAIVVAKSEGETLKV